MLAVSIGELYKHAVAVNVLGVMACIGCGWHGSSWEGYVDHLPVVQPSGTLEVTPSDVALLKELHIKL